MLDDAAVHVGDVDGAIGSDGGGDGTETLVGGGPERLVAVGWRRLHAAIALLEAVAVHEVASDLADERGAAHVVE
ncbi:MAG: hypothetical protein RL354_1939, partial [Planctomycetota bacterium]